nr:EAL domain-containing protein [Sphingopyxis sp.]
FYEPNMHAAADRRQKLEHDLNAAVDDNGLRLVYQPVVTCKGEKVTGFEALLRWNHPEDGPISPGEFIPIAEESSLIEKIGEWVLRRACEEAAGWAIPARVAVNVSPTQFANPAFPNLVSQVLSQTGLAPQRLELEITEGVFMAEDGKVEHQFEALKRIGVRLALDDFGTGYSSLGYLQRAPLNKIKIDQSFVRGASRGINQNAAIIRSIVTLAEALGMETTAEGAETLDESLKRMSLLKKWAWVAAPPTARVQKPAGHHACRFCAEPSCASATKPSRYGCAIFRKAAR